MWPFKKKAKPIPWWWGYVDFPVETETLSIVLSNGKIIVIDNDASKILIYVNEGTYMNTLGEYDV